jgi:hypothetical protein
MELTQGLMVTSNVRLISPIGAAAVLGATLTWFVIRSSAKAASQESSSQPPARQASTKLDVAPSATPTARATVTTAAASTTKPVEAQADAAPAKLDGAKLAGSSGAPPTRSSVGKSTPEKPPASKPPPPNAKSTSPEALGF